MLKFKFAELAGINPDHPLPQDGASQTLSLFGREDIIAATSGDYRAKPCAPLRNTPAVLDEIERRARDTSVVIINESHERSEYRDFIAEVARRLRPLGYGILAIETLSNSPPRTPERYLPTFLRTPELAYFVEEDGFYLSEAGFRQARQAGQGARLPASPL